MAKVKTCEKFEVAPEGNCVCMRQFRPDFEQDDIEELYSVYFVFVIEHSKWDCDLDECSYRHHKCPTAYTDSDTFEGSYHPQCYKKLREKRS